MDYKLILFDLDGTLAEMNSTTPLPGVKEWFAANPDQTVVIVTNQGGVGLRHQMEIERWGDPSALPTMDSIARQIGTLTSAIGRYIPWLACYRYHNPRKDKWSPVPEVFADSPEWRRDWRKPAPGMLLAAMELASATPQETLMVGNGEEDKAAAEAAGCAFLHANVFFKRRPSLIEARKKYIGWLEGEKFAATCAGDDDYLRQLEAELSRMQGETKP